MVTAYSAAGRGFLQARKIPGAIACQNPRIADLPEKRLAFVTGKGGVGKTTVSYALGLAAAARGKRVIVCEIAEQERGSSIFGRDPIGFHETALSEGLWAISIDPDEMVREYLEVLLPVRAMARLLHRSNLFTYLAAATPGLQEVVTIGKAWELAQSERRSPGQSRTYDQVIVDAPATGHGIGFLESPGTFRRIAKAGPLAHQASRIEETITDPDFTGVAIVSTPEEMAVNESGGLAEALPKAGLSLDLVVANCLLPERFSDPELALIGDLAETPDASIAGKLAAAVAEGERARTQRAELDRLAELIPSSPRTELPFLFAERFGPSELQRLAEELA
jgi:anion-transporting  ArsA/GET3 family ATPase